MSLELRELRDDVLGALSAPLLATDQQLASSVFAALPDYYSTTRYLPLVIANDTLGVYEVVYVTGHTAGVNTVTAQRGKEGTTPLAWSVGDTIRVAPTWRDIGAPMIYTTAADVPTDLAVGARHIVTAERVVRERTDTQGSLPAVASEPTDWGTAIASNTAVPAGKRLRLKVLHAISITDSIGYVVLAWGGVSFTQTLAVLPGIILTGSDSRMQAGLADVKVSTINEGDQTVTLRFSRETGAVAANIQVHYQVLLAGV